MKVVVDTNVPVVANGRSAQASPGCLLACIQRLDRVVAAETVVLDDQWRIMREYLNNLRSSGQPGAGDRFLRWVLINVRNPERCEFVPITPIGGDDPDDTDFAEFPDDLALAGFDPNDRKFVAVACAHPQRPPILEATDPDWWNFRHALRTYGVQIEFLCEQEVRS